MQTDEDNTRGDRIRVWDLPIRLFHWTLVALVAVSIYTGLTGGFAEMDYHMFSGYVVLGLLTFRLLWGFVGSSTSRFSSFLPPRNMVAHLRQLPSREGDQSLGHNPLGALSVVAMLLALLVQAVTGLFATDDIMVEGPMYSWVSEDVSELLTSIHHYNTNVIYGLLALHVLAIAFHELYKGERLTRAMVTGHKEIGGTWRQAHPLWSFVLALLVAAACGFLTYMLFT